MDLHTAQLLTSPEGRALVDSLGPYESGQDLRLGTRLRAAGVDPELAAAAVLQSELRHHAQAKCGEFADGMLLTRDGLEQATRLQVAALHAQRYRAAGLRHVADLTCGIGMDAMALASLGLAVSAFESDPATALLAAHNLRHWDHVRVVLADGPVTVRGMDVDAIFADPARRGVRGRTHRTSDYTPPLESILALRDDFPHVGVKVGPGIAHGAIPGDMEAQWVSVDGSVVEAGLWSGGLAHHRGPTALVIRAATSHLVVGTREPSPVGELAEYLYEPDGAVIRAGLVGDIARTVGAHAIDPTIAYLSSSRVLHHPVLRGYRIIDTLPLHVKKLSAALRARDIGVVDIKKRGVDVTPEQLRPQLRLAGSARVTLILTRAGNARVALLAEPLNPQRGDGHAP